MDIFETHDGFIKYNELNYYYRYEFEEQDTKLDLH